MDNEVAQLEMKVLETGVSLLQWETSRVGFHRQQFSSTPVRYDDEGYEKEITFAVSEFTSDGEDFFGVNVPKYALAFSEVSLVHEGLSSEWYLGEFSKPEFAKLYAEFVLKCMKDGLGLALAPVAELDPDPYFLP
jgi:hypothetical protein